CTNAQPKTWCRWCLPAQPLLQQTRCPCRSKTRSVNFKKRMIAMIYNPDDVKSWPYFKPLIIAHDVGRSRDRSTAVVGGNSPCGKRLLGIAEAEELPQGLFGSARASALARVDGRYHHNALIIADLSNDPSYAEVLRETF